MEKIAESTADEVDVPNSVTDFNPSPAFEWYVVRCGFKNEHNKKGDVFIRDWVACSKCANSIVNIIGGTSMTIY